MRQTRRDPPPCPTILERLPRLALLAVVSVLAACAAQDPLEEDLPDMGDFRLAHNIVVAENMQQVPPSRNATPEEWQEIITSEIDRRFGGYEGDKLYHIGINVDGYALAPPGIPIVLNPRSVLVLSVNVWDDALGQKLHEEPEQIVIFEGIEPRDLPARLRPDPHPRRTDAGSRAQRSAAGFSFGCCRIPNGSTSTRTPPRPQRRRWSRSRRRPKRPSTRVPPPRVPRRRTPAFRPRRRRAPSRLTLTN
jgi:hypothetical protein